jgi:hypothetical protein
MKSTEDAILLKEVNEETVKATLKDISKTSLRK